MGENDRDPSTALRVTTWKGSRGLDLSKHVRELVGLKAKEIGASEAKTRLFELLEKVRQGWVFFITKRGQPVAELRPVSVPERRPRFGCDRGRVKIGADFDAPVLEMKEYTE
jgi:prevent-host-death family protein